MFDAIGDFERRRVCRLHKSAISPSTDGDDGRPGRTGDQTIVQTAVRP